MHYIKYLDVVKVLTDLFNRVWAMGLAVFVDVDLHVEMMLHEALVTSQCNRLCMNCKKKCFYRKHLVCYISYCYIDVYVEIKSISSMSFFAFIAHSFFRVNFSSCQFFRFTLISN